jgi:hypothetical protein
MAPTLWLANPVARPCFPEAGRFSPWAGRTCPKSANSGSVRPAATPDQFPQTTPNPKTDKDRGQTAKNSAGLAQPLLINQAPWFFDKRTETGKIPNNE